MLRGHGAVLHGTVPLRFQRRNLKQQVCGHGAVPMQGAGNSSPPPSEMWGSRTGGLRARGRSPGQDSSPPQSVKQERSVEDAMRDFVKWLRTYPMTIA